MKHPHLLLLVLALLLFTLGCSDRKPAAKPEIQKEVVQPPKSPKSNTSAGIKLPWENDPEFIKAKKNNNTPLLMACYQATLPDPILNERHNITQAAIYLRGTVVPPGKVYSLNSGIGRRSEERGFKLGPMYSGGRIVPVVGGGVCKIASVLYNVAILSRRT